MKSCLKINAFTLAEVLITLGIIGVVAAVTIPTLIQNYNTRVWNTAATVFERKLEESLKTMNTQQVLSGHLTTETFVEELSKYLKINKICSGSNIRDCFPDSIYWGNGDAVQKDIKMAIVEKADNLGQNTWGTNVVGVFFADGVSALLAYNPTETCKQDPFSNEISGTDCLAILYDTSGLRAPNSSGKDIRSINVSRIGFACGFEVDGICFSTPEKVSPLSKADCLAQKDTLGIGGCSSASDYWAGAVSSCGGVENMPTREQLLKLATYLYNKENNTSVLDGEKAQAIGFPVGSFSVWSSSEYDASLSYSMAFAENSTNWSYYMKSYSGRYTVCAD